LFIMLAIALVLFLRFLATKFKMYSLYI
jgi:hypothetical protein